MKSIVLLQNTGGLLPLGKLGRLAVIGRLANVPNTGDGGSSNTRPAHVVTPLEGLRVALGGATHVDYDDGSEPERASVVARGADVAVVVVGYTSADEGEFIGTAMMDELRPIAPKPTKEEESLLRRFAPERGQDFTTNAVGGDRDDLNLHPRDEALIAAVCQANPRCVVAIMAGSAVVMESWRSRVPAILMLWYPGMEGGHALADILLGKANPSGKLPFVVPASADDLPFFDKNARSIEYDLWHGYRKLDRDGKTPAFPFGFGLSYTTYGYANLRVEKADPGPGEAIEVRVDVTNTGTRHGEEVVQLYFGVPDTSVVRPPRQLLGFARVALTPGQTRGVRLDVPVSRLAYFDEARDTFVVEPTRYTLMVGGHSRDPQALRTEFVVRT